MGNLNAFDVKKELEYLEEMGNDYDKIVSLLRIAKEFADDLVNKDCYTKSKVLAHPNRKSRALELAIERLRKAGSSFVTLHDDALSDTIALNIQMKGRKAYSKEMLANDD